MTENLRELQGKLRALGYEVPIPVIQSWSLKMLYRANTWADYASRGEQVVMGRPPSLPWFLRRFDKLIKLHHSRKDEDEDLVLPPYRYQGQP